MRDRPLAEQHRVAGVDGDDLGHELGHVGVVDLRDPLREQVHPAPHPIGVPGEHGTEHIGVAKHLLEL